LPGDGKCDARSYHVRRRAMILRRRQTVISCRLPGYFGPAIFCARPAAYFSYCALSTVNFPNM
jgi:hypothetical protein